MAVISTVKDSLITALCVSWIGLGLAAPVTERSQVAHPADPEPYYIILPGQVEKRDSITPIDPDWLKALTIPVGSLPESQIEERSPDSLLKGALKGAGIGALFLGSGDSSDSSSKRDLMGSG